MKIVLRICITILYACIGMLNFSQGQPSNERDYVKELDRAVRIKFSGEDSSISGSVSTFIKDTGSGIISTGRSVGDALSSWWDSSENENISIDTHTYEVFTQVKASDLYKEGTLEHGIFTTIQNCINHKSKNELIWEKLSHDLKKNLKLEDHPSLNDDLQIAKEKIETGGLLDLHESERVSFIVSQLKAPLEDKVLSEERKKETKQEAFAAATLRQKKRQEERENFIRSVDLWEKQLEQRRRAKEKERQEKILRELERRENEKESLLKISSEDGRQNPKNEKESQNRAKVSETQDSLLVVSNPTKTQEKTEISLRDETEEAKTTRSSETSENSVVFSSKGEGEERLAGTARDFLREKTYEALSSKQDRDLMRILESKENFKEKVYPDSPREKERFRRAIHNKVAALYETYQGKEDDESLELKLELIALGLKMHKMRKTGAKESEYKSLSNLSFAIVEKLFILNGGDLSSFLEAENASFKKEREKWKTKCLPFSLEKIEKNLNSIKSDGGSVSNVCLSSKKERLADKKILECFNGTIVNANNRFYYDEISGDSDFSLGIDHIDLISLYEAYESFLSRGRAFPFSDPYGKRNYYAGFNAQALLTPDLILNLPDLSLKLFKDLEKREASNKVKNLTAETCKVFLGFEHYLSNFNQLLKRD